MAKPSMARRSDSAAGDARLDDALALLHFAFRTVTARADAALELRGMGRIHHRILLHTLGITKQSLHRPLQELTTGGYMTSVRCPTNRRTKQLALTSSGAALERSLSGPQRTAFAKVFAAVTPGAVAGWSDVMFELGARRAVRIAVP